MEIKFIKNIKNFFENRKLKKLTDETLEEKLEEKLEANETENLGNIVGYVEDDKRQLQLAEDLIHSTQISELDKKEVIDSLPHKSKEKLFRESIKAKEILARKDINTFLKIIIEQKNLNPYDELYYRLDKAFNDSQLSNILEIIKKERPKEYNEEKVLRIICKQMIVDLKEYGVALPSNIKWIIDKNLIVKDKKSENGKRNFDILEETDRSRLFSSLIEEVEEFKEKNNSELKERQRESLSMENLENTLNRLCEFEKRRREELQQQNLNIK